MSANSVYVAGRFNEASTNIYNSSGSISASLTNTSTVGRNNGMIVSYDTSGNYLWSAKYGGTDQNNYYKAVCTDLSNNVYAGGQFSQATTDIYNANGTVFTSLSHTATANQQYYFMGIIVKYNNVGTCQWAIKLGGATPSNLVCNMYTDLSNNLYVSGRTAGLTMDIYNANGTIAKTITNIRNVNSVMNAFLIKYNTNGVFQWVIKMGGTDTVGYQVFFSSLSIDSNNNVYFGGQHKNDNFYVYNNNNSLVATIANQHGSNVDIAFLIKFDSNGNYLWSTRTSRGDNNSICIDNDNNVYVVGAFQVSDFTIYNSSNTIAATLTNTASAVGSRHNGYVIKYDSNGNYLWATKMGGTTINTLDVAYTVATDSTNNVIVGGYYRDTTIDIYNSSNTLSSTLTNTSSAVNWNGFLVKYNKSGAFLWASKVGGPTIPVDGIYNVSIDNKNDIYVVTSFNSAILSIFNPDGTLGGQITNTANTQTTNRPSAIIKYNPNGNVIWTVKMGAASNPDTWFEDIATTRFIPVKSLAELVSENTSISTILSNGYTLTQLASYTIPKSTWVSSGYTIDNLVSAGYTPAQLIRNSFTLSEVTPFYNNNFTISDLSGSTIPKSDWLSSGQTLGNLVSAGYTPARLLTNSFTLSEVTPFYNGRLFVFDVSASVWNGTYPINNTGGSFTGLINSNVTVSNVVTATSTWTSYSKINSNDGLRFTGLVTYNTSPSINIKQFGGVSFTNAGGCFMNFTGQITATDVPTISWNNLSSWFQGAQCSNYGNINAWDISNVTLTEQMFKSSNFNQNIGDWNVSKVTNLNWMFENATSFNQDISNWKFSSLTGVGAMFKGCSSFNQPLNNWDTSKLLHMNQLFEGCTSFNQPLNNWNTGNVINMSGLFLNCSSFNQPLNNWNTSKVTSMDMMFARSTSFNQPLNNWITGNVTNMSYMFLGTSYNQPLDNWNVSRVTNMEQMFRDAAFNQPINNWNVGNVVIMQQAFYNSPFNQPLDNWNTSKVTNMTNMFSYATGLNSNILTISNWNYSAITPASNFNNFIQLAKVSPSRVSALMTAFSQSSRIGNVALATMPAYVPFSTTVTNALTAKNITFTANTNYATFLSTYTAAQFYAANWLVTDISSRNFTVTELKTSGYSLSQISTGYSISQITSAGYTLSQLIAEGVSVSDLSGNYTIQELTTAGATLSQIRAVYSVSQMAIAGYTLSEIYPQGVSLSDLSNVTIPKSTWVSSGQTLGNLISAGYTPARLLTNSFTLSEVTPFYNGRLFVFDVSSSVWNGTYPITNTGGSLAGLINSSATVGNVVTATSTWTSYSKLNVNDGLFFSNRVTYGYNNSVNVRQYGGIPLANMTSSNSNKGTFDKFAGVITATDAPTIPNNSLYSCFYFATTSTFGNLNAWDVSGVTSLELTFSDARSFNEPLNNWNTSKVTNMTQVFSGTWIFNQPINNWDTGNVTTMYAMFYGARAFNQPVNNWNVSKVTNMGSIFQSVRVFNQTLNNWNTGNVTNMSYMFAGDQNGGFTTFNIDISNLNTSKVTTMERMFWRNANFNKPIGNWNTGNVTNMEMMFYGATNFNQPIGNWNTSKVTNMGQMFGGLSFFNNFNQPIGNWDTGNVTNMNWMFSTTNFNQPIGNWNISKVTRLDGMFYRNRSFNQPLNDWNTGNVTTINAMFAKVSNDPFMTFNQPLDKWNTSKMTDIYAFSQLPMNDNILSLKNWNFSSVLSTNFSGWFSFYISPSITTQLFAALSQNPTLNNVNFGAIDPAYTPIPIDVSNALAAKGIRYTPNDKYNISLSTWTVNQFDPAIWLVTDFSSRNFTIAQLKSRGYSLPQISTAYSISQMLSAGQQLSDLSNCVYKKSQWTAANYSPRQLQSAGFSLSQLLQAEFALSDLSGTTYTSTQWTQSNVTSQQLSDAGFKTTQLVTAGFSVPTFSFQISQSAFLSGNAQIPVVNTGGSFQGFDSSYNTGNATSNINIYWMSYTNNSPQDGLSLISTSYFNDPSINITKFSGIPLAFMSGTNSAAFYQFSGQITATDVPTIPNRSLNACFYGSTSATLGNINGWDISNVTDLTSMFQNNTAFNTSLSNWNTRNVVSMRNTFSGCSAFSKDISMWDLSGVIPNIAQGSMYNIIDGTALNPDTVSVFLLNIINRYTA